MSDRIFSQDEVQRLIKKAAELEAERSVSGKGSDENGLTMDELKHVASEAGLDPQLIEKAASEMDAAPADVKDKVQVNRKEIVSEVWLDCRPERDTMDVLVTELNHMYGTTDELNWWDNLWGTHEGKAKVSRTTNTTEWNYKTEAGMYSTRVLMQQRGERFRIRVSKRQIMDLEWDSPLNNLFLVIPIAVLLGVFGGLGSSQFFGTAWPGIVSGITLSLLSYPVFQHFTKRSIQKNKSEVANTVRQLSNLVLQSSSHQKEKKSTTAKKKTTEPEIEIPDEREETKSRKGKLRNDLRE